MSPVRGVGKEAHTRPGALGRGQAHPDGHKAGGGEHGPERHPRDGPREPRLRAGGQGDTRGHDGRIRRGRQVLPRVPERARPGGQPAVGTGHRPLPRCTGPSDRRRRTPGTGGWNTLTAGAGTVSTGPAGAGRDSSRERVLEEAGTLMQTVLRACRTSLREIPQGDFQGRISLQKGTLAFRIDRDGGDPLRGR